MEYRYLIQGNALVTFMTRTELPDRLVLEYSLGWISGVNQYALKLWIL